MQLIIYSESKLNLNYCLYSFVRCEGKRISIPAVASSHKWDGDNVKKLANHGAVHVILKKKRTLPMNVLKFRTFFALTSFTDRFVF